MHQKESQAQLSARLAKAAQQVAVGARYVHYKQLSYKVLALALREEDNEPCVVYQAEYGDHITFIRPVTNWVEDVEADGKMIKRFTKLEQGDSDMTKQIEQTYTINAPVHEVYKALTDGPTAEKWGAAPAKVDAREGGEFSYWGGDIHGVFTKLVPQKLIEQDWYGHENPAWRYRVVFTFEGNNDSTTVRMVFSGDIQDEQKDIKDWQEYYFTPIKELLEAKG